MFKSIGIRHKGKSLMTDIALLKSIIICNRESPLSTEKILEEMAIYSNGLSKTYLKVVSEYRKNKGKRAFDAVTDRYQGHIWESYKRILVRLEDFDPIELIDQISALQELVLQNQISKSMVDVEKKANLLTIIATASVFAVILNFAVVVVFMDTMAMLGKVF